MPEITTLAQLREVLGTPIPRVLEKDRAAFEPAHRAFLAESPFCLVSTSGTDGTCDVSPKGDPRGSFLVVDDTTLAIPERPGNRRADGFANVLVNPHVGLLFLVPGRGDTLRVNGRARLLTDAPYADRLEVEGHRPLVIMEVTVEQTFFHCSKAFLRSQLWRPESWHPEGVPDRAEIAQALERADEPLEQVRAYYDSPAYAAELY
jgi:PPOX class probable FMN-dependent enzyme